MNPSDDKPTHGMTTLDMMSMPSHVRRITRIFLRNPRMAYEELCEAVDALPPEKRPTREELDDALETLVLMNWLARTEESGQVTYQVEIRKKEGSEVTRAAAPGERRSSSKSDMITGLWNAVEAGAEEAQDGAAAHRDMRSLHRQERDEDTGPPPKKRKGLFGWLRRKRG
jgi:hypothetical protein